MLLEATEAERSASYPKAAQIDCYKPGTVAEEDTYPEAVVTALAVADWVNWLVV